MLGLIKDLLQITKEVFVALMQVLMMMEMKVWLQRDRVFFHEVPQKQNFLPKGQVLQKSHQKDQVLKWPLNQV